MIESQNEKRTILHIIRDVLDVANYPCTKTYLYRRSDTGWKRFSHVFNHSLKKGWLSIVTDNGGNGDLFMITPEGKKYCQRLVNVLDSLKII